MIHWLGIIGPSVAAKVGTIHEVVCLYYPLSRARIYCIKYGGSYRVGNLATKITSWYYKLGDPELEMQLRLGPYGSTDKPPT